MLPRGCGSTNLYSSSSSPERLYLGMLCNLTLVKHPTQISVLNADERFVWCKLISAVTELLGSPGCGLQHWPTPSYLA